MTIWGRTLGPNDDDTIPGTLITAEVATVTEPDALNPKRLIHRLHSGYLIGGRFEKDKWTREKCKLVSEPSSFWSTVNTWRQIHKPTWIVSSDLSKLLTLMGAWSCMDSSTLCLSKRPTANLALIQSPRLRAKLSREIPGLLIDADPPTALICFHRDGWKLICLDLRNYFPGHQPTSLQTSTPREQSTEAGPDRETTFASELETATRVTLDHFRRLCLWHRRLGLGYFAMTISGQALAAFRHKWMRHSIELPPSQADRDFERSAYYGGRNEPMWMGEIVGGRYHPLEGAEAGPTLFQPAPRGPFHLVDARSFYGAVMAFQSVPFRCIAEGDGWPPGDKVGALSDGDMLAHVRISSASDEFPIRLTERTIYAVGDFWTYLCGPELQRAYLAGCIKDFGHWRQYECEPVLQEYAWRLWQARQEAEANRDDLLAVLIKGLIARLHGKFSQRMHKWQVAVGVEAPARWHRWFVVDHSTGKRTNYRSIGDSVQFQTEGGDAKHCFPAISAFVTAWGREYLRTWQRIAGTGNVLYLSTDSLIVTEQGRLNLETQGIIGNHGIGSVRVQETSGSVAVYGCNSLKLGNHIIAAGIPNTVPTGRGQTCRYVTRCLLPTTITRKPLEQVTEIETIAYLGPREEIRRVGDGGWLSRIKLTPEVEQWMTKPPAIPALIKSV